MKVVMIYYGGFLRGSGGAFFHAINLENELRQMGGYKVEIITLDSLPIWFRYLPHVLERIVNVVYAPFGFLCKGYVTKILYKYFFYNEVDLCVFEDVYISWNSKTPSLSMLHAVWSDNLQAYLIPEDRQNRFRKHEANKINKIDHFVATVSYPYREYINGEHLRGYLTKEINVIELGIDQSKFLDDDKLKRMRKSLIYSGALEARKNIFFLLDVFKRLYEMDSEYTLTIIGWGFNRDRLEGFVNENHLPVRFLGRLDHKTVISELHRHEIYIHTSVKESFSYSLLEAKLAGLKTCAYSKLEVPKEFIDVAFDSFCEDEWCRGIINNNSEPVEFNGSKYTAQRMTLSTLNLVNC